MVIKFIKVIGIVRLNVIDGDIATPAVAVAYPRAARGRYLIALIQLIFRANLITGATALTQLVNPVNFRQLVSLSACRSYLFVESPPPAERTAAFTAPSLKVILVEVSYTAKH